MQENIISDKSQQLKVSKAFPNLSISVRGTFLNLNIDKTKLWFCSYMNVDIISFSLL